MLTNQPSYKTTSTTNHRYSPITDIKSYVGECAGRYLKELTENNLPFWLEHGLDPLNGGIYTCLDREGSLLDSDKSVWFQGRAAWTFLFAYNNIEQKPEWLEAGKSCIRFIEDHCFDHDGRMYYQVTTDGSPVRKRRYVFSETFAAIAFAEYSKAAQDPGYAKKALELFELILRYSSTRGLLDPKFCEGHNGEGLSLNMILLNTAVIISETISSPILSNAINHSIGEITGKFMKPEFKAVMETVAPDGSFINSIAGRTLNPGHTAETGWFIIEAAMKGLCSEELVKTGLTIVDWAWDWGWDKKHGGILYFRDCLNRPVQEYWHDMKFWWPQTDTALAMLHAYRASGDVSYLEKHRLVDTYQFEKLKDPLYPEWFGYLHYDGSISQTAKGNFYKGPYHIPRMLMKGYLLCKEILSRL